MSIIKIPVKITTVVEDSIEVELPVYTKTNEGYFVVTESGCVRAHVIPNFNISSISVCTRESAFESGYEMISKEDYEATFENALLILKSINS